MRRTAGRTLGTASLWFPTLLRPCPRGYRAVVVGWWCVRDSVSGELTTPVSLNRYTYAFNDPLNMFDPDGHWPGFVDSAIAWAQEKLGQVKNAVTSSVGAAVSSVVGAATQVVGAVASGLRSANEYRSKLYNAARAKLTAAVGQFTQNLAMARDFTKQLGAQVGQFAAEHRDDIVQGVKMVTPILVGVAVTGVCVAATAGVGTLGCAVLGGAAAGAVAGAMECSELVSRECAGRVGREALIGAGTALVAGPGTGRVLGVALRGGAANASASAFSQYTETGSIDPGQTAMAFLEGGALAGGLHAGSKLGARPVRSGRVASVAGSGRSRPGRWC